MVREAKKPSFVRLDKRTNEELKTQTKYLCDVCGVVKMAAVCGVVKMAAVCGVVKMAAVCGVVKMAAVCGVVKMAAVCGVVKMAAVCGVVKMAAVCGVLVWPRCVMRRMCEGGGEDRCVFMPCQVNVRVNG